MLHYTCTKHRTFQTHQAKWEKTLSVEQATTSQLIARNSSTRSLKAMISVGQTKVLKIYPKKTSDCIYLNKNMRNQRLYQQNYLLYAYRLHYEHCKCSCYINKGQTEFKRRIRVWGVFFHSEKILIDNGLIIADYHYFIFCSTYKSSG